MTDNEFEETVLRGTPSFTIAGGDYNALCRSNYFRVKDEREFRVFCQRWGLDVIKPYRHALTFIERHGDSYIPITIEITDDYPRFGFKLWDVLPSGYWDSAGHFVEQDFFVELATHLCDGEVAVCIETGNDQMIYMNGAAVAVNSKGETVTVALDGIYELAELRFGVKPSAPSE